MNQSDMQRVMRQTRGRKATAGLGWAIVFCIVLLGLVVLVAVA